ncbi:MAG TPA: DUF362 domain-containing protein [Candidatus Bathyarchaeia archaeon]|nr:DUF362 domain-containing protein [Candidatus Bathyarchaeia archaeon]
MSLVSLVSSINSDFQETIQESLRLIQFDMHSNIKSVVIKPDLCYYWDHTTGLTTNPHVVGDVIDLLRSSTSQSLDVLIVGSDTQAAPCEVLFKFLGYSRVATKKNARLVNLSKTDCHEIEVNVAGTPYELLVPSVLDTADFFVTVPKMKLSSEFVVSCALKNSLDIIQAQNRAINSSPIDAAIVAANKALKPDLCLVDGTWVRGKQTKKLGLIMASIDPVAVDSLAAKILGINPQRAAHIALAHKEGLGTITPKVVGDSLAHYTPFFRRTTKDKVWDLISKMGLATVRKLGIAKQ